MLKDIFSHKIAIFVYGVLVAFSVSFFIVDNVYRERIDNLKYDIDRKTGENISLKNANRMLDETFNRMTKTMNGIDVKDLVSTNQSQQETIVKFLEEKDSFENRVQELSEKIEEHEDFQRKREEMTLMKNFKFIIIEGEDDLPPKKWTL